MEENSAFFQQQLVRRKGNRHLDILDRPFAPCSSVQPYPAVFHELLAFQFGNDREQQVEADLLRTVRIGQVAGGEYLVRFYLLDHFLHNSHILLAYGLFFHRTRFVERQIQEMDVQIVQAHKTGGSQRLPTADQRLSPADSQ